MNKKIFFLLFAVGIFSSGCSSMGAKAWDRDLLAKESMTLGGDPLQSGFENKIYFSREGASGGSGYSGGGCGCN